MAEGPIVLGFYKEEAVAVAALKELQAQGFRHSSVINHSEDGVVTVERPSSAMPFGTDVRLVEKYKHWVVRGETLVVVQAHMNLIARARGIMDSAVSNAPTVFILLPTPTLTAPQDDDFRHSPLVTMDSLRIEASSLAATHRLACPKSTNRRSLQGHLRDSEATLKYVETALATAVRIGQPVSMSAEWLLDNAYILQGHIDDFRKNLPTRFYNELPLIAEGAQAGFPRVYAIAAKLIVDTDSRLDRERIYEFLNSYQTVTPLRMGELWALPLMLRLRLIECVGFLAIQVERREREREHADFLANRLLTAARQDRDRLLPFVTQLAREHPNPSAHLAEQLVSYLYDEESALSALRNWLEYSLGAPLETTTQQEQLKQTTELVALANAISTLRQFAQFDWRELFESLSEVEAVLQTDPADVYGHMDFFTRDRYRHAVEEISETSQHSEREVAARAREFAAAGTDELTRHIGYFLVDLGRAALEAQLGCHPRRTELARRWARKHAVNVYLGAGLIGTISALVVLASMAVRAGASLPVVMLIGVLSVLPASELTVQLVNYLVTRLMPPAMLPRMYYEKGIPDDCRTLVIVPMMLFTPDSVRDEVRHLEIRYLANPDPNLRYGLLSDFSDAPNREMPHDSEQLEMVVQGIQQLNERYDTDCFFLFHRERHWSESEQHWIGWERKRGKLEQLNAYLMGDASAQRNLMRVGNSDKLKDIRFVITLDADTQLPRDTARRLVETLAHPLNRPHTSSDGHTVERGYTIIQPGVSTSLPSATSTRFSRIFTDATGIDPYTHVSSDAYQDLVGESSYQGKGIYDVAVFHRALTGRFPESHLLSHDLLEGAHVRVGLASDIELLDQFPGNYLAYAKRRHRWVRGDWQIIDWLTPKVPAFDGSRTTNPLSTFNRWKIADNLRRSLLPLSSLLLLIAAWTFSPVGGIASLFITAVLFVPVLAMFTTRLTTRPEGGSAALHQLGTTLLRGTMTAALLPEEAFSNLDAIVRVLYRRLVSHRLLLQWQTAHEAQRVSRKTDYTVIRLTRLSLAFGLFAAAIVYSHADDWPAALPFALVWLMSPVILAWLNRPITNLDSRELSEADRQQLRYTARETWRYFDDFVNAHSNWLPPDNYQTDLKAEVAERTSPTNIGLGMISTLAAYDFGYVTPDDMLARTHNTLETVEKMEKYEGHVLNWYDTSTLAPLLPRYVSMVDSGNLLGAFWALAQGIDDLAASPLLGASAFLGLRDTLKLIKPPEGSAKAGDQVSLMITDLEALFSRPVDDIKEMVRRIRWAASPSCLLVKMMSESYPAKETCHYWAVKLEQQVSAWNGIVDRYLRWVEVLASPPEGGLLAGGPDVHEWRRQALASAPSMRTLASGDSPGLRELVGLQRRSEELNLSPGVRTWLDSLGRAALISQHLANERLAEAENVTVRLHHLADGMNMRFMYDQGQRLFYTGFNVTDRRMDAGYYNLLASEARLGSFVSIARGEVPVEHWWALGRPFGSAFGENVLLSWGGTMFEYLMPLILTRSFENSMLDHACKAAVTSQIAYGKLRKIPWGISESSFSAVDAQRTYQYQAFGVPGLGLKRGLEADLVVAPYATALALSVAPIEAVRNLHTLSTIPQIVMHDGYGFYEAIDYTRPQGPSGTRGVVVHSYMAHHQGMILSAIDNALHKNILQRRFHNDPRVRATESLLYERIPVSPAIVKTGDRQESLPRVQSLVVVPSVQRTYTQDSATPQICLLSNGAYSVMVTNAGSGYSQWRGVEINRWKADTTRDHYGSFLFLRDLDTGTSWSAGHQPLRTVPALYRVTFTPDKAEIQRRDDDIETITEIVVSPEDNVEVRRITMTNRSRQKRRLELTTYLEVALAAHNDDRAHPAFSKLFVETEALPEHGALLAWRRPRSSEETPLWAFHVAAGEFDDEAREFETDRARFIGRGRDSSNPIAMEGRLSNSSGAVLDSVFSLRRRVTLEAGERLHIAFITGAASSRDEAVALTEKYSNLQASTRAIEMAWTHAQLELRHLRIHHEETQAFQQLASYILYPSGVLRPSPERLARNVLGQTQLWSHGISGDLPIVVVTIGDLQDVELVRQVLIAHSYWQARGLKVDVLILNEEASNYEQPLLQQLRRLVEAHVSPALIEQAGGVFLRPFNQIPEEERTLLLTVARAVLVAARGGLADQLSSPVQNAPVPPKLVPNMRSYEEPSPPLPFMELPFFNGIGGFTQDGREYVIYLGPGTSTPLPWINVMANPSFGAIVSESGAGYAWYGNSQSNRLNPWSNDPVSDPGGSAIYLRDEEIGSFWSPTPYPIREKDAYRTRHGQGYTVFEHNSHALEQELTMFVPIDESEDVSLTALVHRLKLTNHSSRRRKLTAVYYTELTMGSLHEDTQLHVRTQWDAISQCLFARNPYHPDQGSKVAFVASSLPVTSYTGDRTAFMGRNGSLKAPVALTRTRFSGRVGAGLDPCAAIQVTFELEPGEQTEIVFLFGEAADMDQARRLAQKLRGPASAEQALKKTSSYWDHILTAVQVETPDIAVNFMMNRWLLYQDLSCRIWGRSAFYQSGGAFGFRDQLQDVMAMVYSAPGVARDQILRSAARQFIQGDVQHWWHPQSGAGVRTQISDDLLFLPFVTAHYVRVTGDSGILDEVIPFLDGKLLTDSEHEAFYVPTISLLDGTLLEHCRRAIAKGVTSGPNGLPLIGSGDWNDGLNRVGIEGKGESVWLAWFAITVLNEFSDLLLLKDKQQSYEHSDDAGAAATKPDNSPATTNFAKTSLVTEADTYRNRAQQIALNVEAHAWDGKWYLRAFFDDGAPLGSINSEEAQIDSLGQSWGVISGAAQPDRARAAMREVEDRLIRTKEQLILLFTPPFDNTPHDPGYIKGYPPGVRENGGQYTHGSLWVPLAFARLGAGDKTVDILRMMNPVEHARGTEDTLRYKVEPYVVAADIYSLAGHEGRGGWTWYTGAAGWMYRVWLEEVFGFHLRGETLTLKPCIASTWERVTLRYRFRTSIFQITIDNPEKVCTGIKSVTLDGETIPDQVIHLKDDATTHAVHITMGQISGAPPKVPTDSTAVFIQ